MGRKSKLKHDKRRAATAATAAADKMNNNHEALATESTVGLKLKAITNFDDYASLFIDNDFPKSDLFVQVMSLNEEYYGEEVFNKCIRGAKEYGCVHSMFMISRFRKQPHLRQPWLLDACIHGSIFCVKVMLKEIYWKAKPCPPKALVTYWMKMQAKYEEWSNTYSTYSDQSHTKLDDVSYKDMAKDLKDRVGRICAVCGQEDTDTLTLRQCMGCSTYCYCSKFCQTLNWEEHNHKGECRQLKILNKYHKPYANEIRKAAIRGETTYPALQKLRHKLGLSRPTQDYQDFSDNNTHKGKPINPYAYVVGREDGTVWIGSTPTPVRPVSSDTDTDTGTAATAATITDVMSMKVGAMFIEKSEFVDALRKARNDTSDRKMKSTVV